MAPATDEQISRLKKFMQYPNPRSLPRWTDLVVQSLLDRIEQDQEELSIYKLSSGSGLPVESIKRLMEI